ncbi:MAG: hypothetical protein AAGA48_26140 [Myxococcota bacterium]
MKLGPISTVPPLPESVPAVNPPPERPDPGPPAIPKVAPIPAAEAARSTDPERRRFEKMENLEAEAEEDEDGPQSLDGRRLTKQAAAQMEAAATLSLVEVAREVAMEQHESHHHDDPCGPCTSASEAYTRNTDEALQKTTDAARPKVKTSM